jgi:hypothetical protein
LAVKSSIIGLPTCLAGWPHARSSCNVTRSPLDPAPGGTPSETCNDTRMGAANSARGRARCRAAPVCFRRRLSCIDCGQDVSAVGPGDFCLRPPPPRGLLPSFCLGGGAGVGSALRAASAHKWPGSPRRPRDAALSAAAFGRPSASPEAGYDLLAKPCMTWSI